MRRLQTPAEAAADELIVQDDLVERQAVTLAAIACARDWTLRAGPDFAPARRHVHGAIDRLQRRMRQERKLEMRFDRLSVGDGFAASRRPWRRRPSCSLAAWCPAKSQRIDFRVGAFVPGDGEGLKPLLRRPKMNRRPPPRDRRARRPGAPRDRLCRTVVDMADLTAKHRRGGDRREFDVGRKHIDAVERRAVDLARVSSRLSGLPIS